MAMELKINERAAECQAKITEANEELFDYQSLVMMIRSVQAVLEHPEKYTYSPEDFQKVISKIEQLGQKHELRIPSTVDWSSVEIV